MKEDHNSIEFWNRPENKYLNLDVSLTHLSGSSVELHKIDDKLPSCSYSNCNLPLILSNQFYCSKCKDIFCSEHLHSFNHKCKYENININMNNQYSEIIIHPKCSLNSCSVKMDLCNRFKCLLCDKLYCMSHRHDFSHSCLIKKNNV